VKPQHISVAWHRQYDAKLDGCFGGLYRGWDCDGAVCRASCDALKQHRFEMRKRGKKQ